jgi:hypothetical protein
MLKSLRPRFLGRVITTVLVFATPACDKKQSAATTPAPSVPWQPHGLRVPTVRCDFATPTGWTRSDSPMPDHIAELYTSGHKSVAILSQRVEPELASAQARVLAYYRSGFLTAAGAKILEDAPLEGTKSAARLLSMRMGPDGAGRIETVILLGFPEQPIVEIVARHDEVDTQAREAVLLLARSVRCSK